MPRSDRYFRHDTSPLVDGWFPTGDVATIDRDGFMRTGKRHKLKLREQFRDYILPSARQVQNGPLTDRVPAASASTPVPND
jgi:long-subunit acyl-CoA synthetase (AMP-forming)